MAISTDSQAGGLRQAVQRRPLLFFFLLAYAVSWVLSIPFILGDWGLLQGDMRPVFALKSFGPFIAAYGMVWAVEGKPGVQRFRARFRQAKAGVWWYLFIFIGIPALFMLALLLQPGATQGYVGFTPAAAVTYVVSYIIVFFGGGPLGEEPGWRGFALPRMQHRFGPLVGTLLLGLIWTCWHLPDFLTSAQGGGPGTGLAEFLVNFPIFLLLVLSLAVLLTWVYNHTQGSILLAILAHTSVNVVQVALVPLFPAVTITMLNTAALVGFGIPALLILAFTRGRLGYTPDE